MRPYSLEEIKEIVVPIAMAHGVKSLSLFGSYSRGTARSDSDVDIRIEKGRLRSLFQLCGFRLALEDALRLPVDLVTNDCDSELLNGIKEEEVLLYREA